ncbi:MAG: hypothetical protein CUN50_00555 [Candidatus Thermofonsia Clade 1 bacterium]|jgi:hypothetical protein|uniref:Uncharacterized protein n=1 Tax=Candidatus Thermofonsia Clade 1 bacterium TaxID=2364210 RepID=A0A2M8Q0W0_9CHLR|nr:MAG: hypothetical protein CUN50_00555 [Candidatus Thermofonsia Clade 1 bacterium]
MAEKTYRAIQCRRIGLNQALKTLRAFVRERRLAEYIPFVRYEKNADTRCRGEYYIVLEMHQAPNEVLQQLQELGIGIPIPEELTEGSLDAWLSPNRESTQFFRQVYLEKPAQFSRPTAPSDDLSEFSEGEESYLQSNEPFNKLLYWLSARGSGTWQIFRHACEQLGIDNKPRQVFRRLRLLGHLGYLDQGRRWQVYPPYLVQSADGSYRYLVGQRTPSLLKNLPVERFPQRGTPDLIKVPPRFAAEGFCEAGIASLRLAESLPSWRDLPNRWQALDLPMLRYLFNRWDGAEFSIRVERPDQVGLYRCEDTEKQSIRYAFYDGSTLWQGDWYGLQYVANAHLNLFPRCVYSQAHHTCLLERHLPDLHECALVLASGILPEKRDGGLLFRHVSAALINTLSDKLGFSVSYKD